MREKDDHYEYIAVYVDDLLVFSKDSMRIIETIRNEYDLKGVGAPEYYLGGDVDLMSSQPSTKDINGVLEINHDEQDKHLNAQWLHHNVKTAFSARTYIKNTIQRLERMIGKVFATQKSPMLEHLHPEIDDSPYLDEGDHHRFRSMIGCANWLITLGRFDIAYATNSLSRHTMAPR